MMIDSISQNNLEALGDEQEIWSVDIKMIKKALESVFTLQEIIEYCTVISTEYVYYIYLSDDNFEKYRNKINKQLGLINKEYDSLSSKSVIFWKEKYKGIHSGKEIDILEILGTSQCPDKFEINFRRVDNASINLTNWSFLYSDMSEINTSLSNPSYKSSENSYAKRAEKPRRDIDARAA